MKFTVLTDDKAKGRGILAEHGMSLFIEYGDLNILFDTGQSDVYLKNAAALRLDLNQTDFIVLSHGHYDHCGGVGYLPYLKKNPKIYLQKSAVNPKYAVNADGKTYREIGIPWTQEIFDRLADSLVMKDGIAEIYPGISLLGKIRRTVEFEGEPKGFFIKDGDELTADLLDDEQMLVFDTDDGLVVFLGCSHPGVINCLEYAISRYPGKKIHTLAAGMHLESVSQKRLEQTIQAMLDLNIQKIMPLHCTGIHAIDEMKRNFGEQCQILYAGDTVEI